MRKGPGAAIVQVRFRQKREPSGRLWRYSWNAAGMLETVTRPDGSEVRFCYDPLGRRIQKSYRGQTTH